MGASGWWYFTPYQVDISQALQDLRDMVFKEGNYFAPWMPFQTEGKPWDFNGSYLNYCENMFDYADQWFAENQDFEDEFAEEKEDMKRKREKFKQFPQTIEDLIEICATEGTHSILDISQVAPEPDFGVAAPFPVDELIEIFETDKPTRLMVEDVLMNEKEIDLVGRYDRWQAAYFIVYRQGKPDEIFFGGFSGD